MSKPVVRIVGAVLISLVVIAIAVTGVQASGVLSRAGGSAAASMSAENRALGKENMKGMESNFYGEGMDSGHDCGGDPSSDF